MAFATNIAAQNAARAMLKAQALPANALKQFFSIEKHDGEWHSLQIAEFPQPREPWESLKLDCSAEAWQFPRYEDSPEAQQAAADEAANAEALRNPTPKAGSKYPAGWVYASSIQSPVKAVHHIADEMIAAARAAGRSAPSRKEVQDECVRRGIASGTARTQYQAWKKANDATNENAANAAALSAALNSRK